MYSRERWRIHRKLRKKEKVVSSRAEAGRAFALKSDRAINNRSPFSFNHKLFFSFPWGEMRNFVYYNV